MIEPITGIGLILSLIPLYQRERDKAKQASTEDFFKWLLEHNFTEIKDSIAKNQALTFEIEKLLRMNQEELHARFDEMDKKLICMMNSMQEFRSLIKMLAPSSGLTEQEESILRQFVESGAQYLSNFTTLEKVQWFAGSKEIQVKAPKTLNSSLKQLTTKGYLVELYNNNLPYYELTEQAVEYVDNLKKDDLSEQAKRIIICFANSGQELMCYVYTNPPTIHIPNSGGIDVSEPRFLEDDLKKLVEKKLIIPSDSSHTSVKMFKITRKGVEYSKEL